MITYYKVTEIFCAVDEFCIEFDKQIDKKSLMSSDGKSHRSVRKYLDKPVEHEKQSSVKTSW